MQKTHPFPDDQVATDNEEDRANALAIGEYFRKATQTGVLMSLGASNFYAVPGTDKMGGLMFTARILPMT